MAEEEEGKKEEGEEDKEERVRRGYAMGRRPEEKAGETLGTERRLRGTGDRMANYEFDEIVLDARALDWKKRTAEKKFFFKTCPWFPFFVQLLQGLCRLFALTLPYGHP